MRISLKAARVNKGMTQKEVATALRTTKKTIGAWESGKTMPKLNKIEAICALYDVKYDDIQWRA